MSGNTKKKVILYAITAILFAVTAVLYFLNGNPGDNWYGCLTAVLAVLYVCLTFMQIKNKDD